MDEKELYKIIARELDANRMDPARWTQAFAEAGGDREKARAIYIRLRHADLAPRAQAAPPAADPQAALRVELAAALASSGRDSLYRTLGVQATASDAEIASAIRRLRDSGAPMDAELRYAVETLGTPAGRARYDQSLASGLGLQQGSAAAGDELEEITDDAPASVFLQWWATRKVTVLVSAAVVALLAIVALPFYQTRTAAEFLDNQTAMEQDRRAKAEEWKARQTARIEADREEARKRRAADQASYQARQTQAERDRLMQRIDDDQRRLMYAQQRRTQQEEAQQRRSTYERERQQQEARRDARQADARAAQEAAYWSCFNDAIDRRDSAYAYRACAHLKR
ncbi:MAG: hypothetical protein KDG55_18970 [Rhodocyclaceae bacterium]|nr:hypothetical protein [Rhodocyclaceae bacterium]